MNLYSRLTIAMILSLVFCGCTKSNRKESGIKPARVDASAKASENWGLVDFDERGNLKHALTLSLDHAPEEEKFSGKFPRCHAPLEESLELGEVTCIKGNDKAIKLLVGHLIQDCFTDPKFKKLRAAQNLTFPGCQSAKILGYKFNPLLRLNIERK